MSRPARRPVVSLAAVAAGLALGVLGADAAFAPGVVDLQQVPLRFTGATTGEAAGTTIAAAGDVNGDGRGDLIVGAPGAGRAGQLAAGAVYIVFGQPGLASIDLANLGSRGIRIEGAEGGDRAGTAVAGAGDMNGDGRGDILLGAPGVDGGPGRVDAGAVYVVYGQATGGAVDLGSLKGRGIRATGDGADDQFGASIASAGDVDGDGRVDIVGGAPGAERGTRPESGAAYVVFGQQNLSDIPNVRTAPPARAIEIRGAAAEDVAGASVSGAGDVNADGRADILVGAPFADRGPGAGLDVGAAYVVFGSSSIKDVDLATLGAGGLRLDGQTRDDETGSAVAAAGDLNGDGRGDIAVGAPGAANRAGAAFVVLGRSGAAAADRVVDLGAAGAAFRVSGAAAGDGAGSFVGSADVNRDGRRDLLVGAPGARPSGRLGAGSAYVVFGRQVPGGADLAALGSDGIRYEGGAAGDEVSVSAAQDLDADGVAELAIGAPGASPSDRLASGLAVIVSGASTPTPGAPPTPSPGGSPTPPAGSPPLRAIGVDGRPDPGGSVLLRAGTGWLATAPSLSRRSLRRLGCVKMQAGSTGPARLVVTVAPYVRSPVRPFGQKVSPFAVAGSRPFCVRVPSLAGLKRLPGAVRLVLRVEIGGATTTASRVVRVTP